MLDSERGEMAGENVDVEAEIAARARKRDGAGEKQANSEIWVGGLGCLGMIALLGWGVVSLGAWMFSGGDPEKERSDVAAATASVDQGPSDTTVKAGAMSAITERAVDPGSVRFRNVFVVRQSSGTKAVCGEFNAKNRMGGYNGYERFISAGVGQYTYSEADVADFSTAWSTICQR